MTRRRGDRTSPVCPQAVNATASANPGTLRAIGACRRAQALNAPDRSLRRAGDQADDRAADRWRCSASADHRPSCHMSARPEPHPANLSAGLAGGPLPGRPEASASVLAVRDALRQPQLESFPAVCGALGMLGRYLGGAGAEQRHEPARSGLPSGAQLSARRVPRSCPRDPGRNTAGRCPRSAHLSDSSPPWDRKRATVASMSSTSNMIRRIPSVCAGAAGRLGADRRRGVEHGQLDRP